MRAGIIKGIERHTIKLNDELIINLVAVQAKRKEEGRCLHCGELLPMSAMGLLDCKVCT